MNIDYGNMNKKSSQNEFTVGSFKGMVSAIPPAPNPKVIPIDKKKSEF